MMNTLGSRLKSLRGKKKITQRELAQVLKVPRDTVANWEINRGTPNIETISEIADYFDVSADYLLGRTDNPSPRPKIETIAAHRTDDPMDDLPEEARKSVEEFLEYIYKKYGKKGQ